MEVVREGCIENIIYRNNENGYTVMELLIKGEDELLTCVGTFSFVSEGEFVRVTGNMTTHSLYGEQLQITSCEFKEPADSESVERYLASGAIKGVGKALAARIVKRFGDNVFDVIENNPERLSEVRGISDRMAREISSQFEEKRDMRNAMIFLQQYGISSTLAVKIYSQYGAKMYDIIKENPYRLADDIQSVGFKTADELAFRMGVRADSEYRIRSGILYSLLQAAGNGHTYLPLDKLLACSTDLLGVVRSSIERELDSLAIERKIVITEAAGQRLIYSAVYYYMELNTARMLLDLNIKYDISPEVIKSRTVSLEKKSDFTLDDLQRTAVFEAARNGVFVLTGGPGTGKTTTINTIINFFEAEGMELLLAAPTGRAAKRMTETTGREARTIHRMLELTKGLDDSRGHYTFEKNETNPLEADVIIIDEMSMVDLSLMNSLLRAVSIGTRLILVGDVNQLPSVGAGNVLRDIIDSNRFNVVRLTKIFRQAAQSDIVVNAHRINNGENILMDNKSRDFFFLQRDDVNIILGIIVMLVRDKMPKYVSATCMDIQVLTPMRKGELGVENLNRVLQQYLNPPSKDKQEKEYRQAVFREGDKVMQIKNNYQLAWEVQNSYGMPVDSGMGVFNGDCGIIKEINDFSSTLCVEFDEGRRVEYLFAQLDELELAYAVTIHKSQGSEYPAVVIPILSGPRLLFNRNLLYTAVTRAKSCVTIVGSRDMVQYMIDNESEQRRFSGLTKCIVEMTP